MFPARVFSAIRILAAAALVALAIPAGAVTSLAGMSGQVAAADAPSVQVYGAWHCGNDYCTWGTVRDMTDFDVRTIGSSIGRRRPRRHRSTSWS